MAILETIIPIFVIIFLGLGARRQGLITDTFIAQANRVVYSLAIPALVFRAVSKTALSEGLNTALLAGTLLPIIVVWAGGWGLLRFSPVTGKRHLSAVHCAFHCNIGYIGLAVSYYYLGDSGFSRSAIVAGFIILLQNFLAIFLLGRFGSDGRKSGTMREQTLGILTNPVILSSIAGIVFATFNIPIPELADRTLHILSGMALPTALLIIGATLSFNRDRTYLAPVLLSSVVKLILLPGLALVFYQASGLAGPDYLPALILLASPAATVSVILARELGGDAEFAAGVVSTSTLLSALSFVLWIQVVG